MQSTVTAIVPAFNEEKRIKNLLQTLLNYKEITEILCVNDGSTDNTGKIAENLENIRVIHSEENFGKAHAITKGLLEAKGDIVMFIDADLTGLKEEYISSLLHPLDDKSYDASIGYRTNILDKYMFMPLSGERAYLKKDLIPHIAKLKNKGYGLELYLNYAFKDKRVKLLALKGVKSSHKLRKQSYKIATKGIVDECGDVINEIFSQKNPITFFINAYIYPFYAKKSLKFAKKKFTAKYVYKTISDTIKHL